MKVTIFYGTETGNAEMCADSVASHLRHTAEVEVHDMADVGIGTMEGADLLLFITSTFGEGELPAGADTFFTELVDAAPDLHGVDYAVFGLGDSYYDGTFNRGGHLVSEHLAALGGSQVGEVGCYDTSTGEPPEDVALLWAQELPLLQKA